MARIHSLIIPQVHYTFVVANGNHVRIQSPSGEESIVAAANGSADLYYDNAKKFETTNAGITVTLVLSN